MRIAVDKNNYTQIKNDGNEYILLYDSEPLDFLLSTNLHCINYKNIHYVDINTSRYNIECMKRTDITDKHLCELPKKKDYKFVIIVPNFNNEHGVYEGKSFIRNCIESILKQSYKNFKLIIVDDCSTDNSVNTIKEYAEKDDRIHLIQNKRKRYNGGSRNVAIEYALSNYDFDYFCFLDSDDWWKHENVLKHINEKLYNHELLMVGCEMIYADRTSKPVYNEIKCYKDLYSFTNEVWCTAWARVIRKDKIVYFCENTLMEDRVWTYRLADNINFENTINSNEILYCWNRMNTTNSVSQVRDDFWKASAYCHIGHQLQLITQMKHKEMIPLIQARIDEGIRKLNAGEYRQF